MSSIVSVRHLTKTYKSGFQALRSVSLEIEDGEILALLGPNGAGKTTLISTICGIVQPTSGSVSVGGHDVVRNYRAARDMIGLVPQEISLEPFEKVFNAVSFSRGLFGKAPDPAHVERVLRQLSLWDKKDSAIMPLSGGMKRRVLIAKALAHAPRVLFLDEPSAGVDVELRKDMWSVVADLKAHELLSAPVSYLEIVIGYVGAAEVKSILIGLVILATAYLFIDLPIAHPIAMFALLALTSFSFSLFGFIIGIWAKDFQQMQN